MFSVHPKCTLRIEQPRGPSSSPPWQPPPSRRASPQPCTPRTTASPASPDVDADEDGDDMNMRFFTGPAQKDI